MIYCQECGHDCTPGDFESLVGLCIHLYLDALAAQKRSEIQVTRFSLRIFQKQKTLCCSPCHGLISIDCV